MADTLTHLRELGVGYGILIEKKIKNDPEYFLKFCREHIQNCKDLKHEDVTRNKVRFSKDEYAALLNACNLGRYISSLDIIDNKNPLITWEGGNTQSGNPFDLTIDGIPFSLKEDSFILQNMGLSRILNILTDSTNYKRGLHIFKDYAPKELNDWFEVARDEAIISLKNQSFEYTDRGNNIKLAYTGNSLILDINGYREIIKEFSNCDYLRFENTTSNKYREKVFSKFIKSELQNNDEYLRVKHLCSVKAGENLINSISEHVKEYPSPNSLHNLFRINDIPYYYAKNGNGVNEVYAIPNKDAFFENIKILSVVSSVPKSQLNIFTTIQNMKTYEKLIVRNELRYSHGQLNGTPEAKMYIDSGSIEIAYEKVVSPRD